MNVSIICVGKLKEKFWTDACAEYSKRMKGFCGFEITEVDEERIKNDNSPSDIRTVIEKEGKR
ncbi:MAG: 23S rRNA (pseudouridine(1915)-N(3))-methyltransferase RlmH, partial [Oscillospiraceae bacterium]|nr:23S rRNA (pseudouridine(1915)-N(3))-methyltransferase RlmH [Oscillospiraceae bacterium]